MLLTNPSNLNLADHFVEKVSIAEREFWLLNKFISFFYLPLLLVHFEHRHRKLWLNQINPGYIRLLASCMTSGCIFEDSVHLKAFSNQSFLMNVVRMEFITRSLMECICMTHLSFYRTYMARHKGVIDSVSKITSLGFFIQL